MSRVIWLVLVIGLFTGCGDSSRAVALAQPETPLPPVLPQRWTNEVGMEFCLVQAGTCMLGQDPPGSDSIEVHHQVTVSRPFYLGRMVPTRAMLRKFRAETGIDHPDWGLDPEIADRSWQDGFFPTVEGRNPRSSVGLTRWISATCWQRPSTRPGTSN